MENKPVAWIDYLEHSDVYDLNVSGRGIPLYTAPRELSDEEILDLWVKKNNLNGAQDIVDFARAILKKASEPKTYKPKIVDMALRTDNQGNVLPQKEIKESE
jgi:hypothetical protein